MADRKAHRWSKAIAAALALACAAQMMGELDELRAVPLDHPAIRYEHATPGDRVAAVREAFAKRELAFDYEDHFGHLRAVLKALDVPVSSQVLVFSKTSFQAPHIWPRLPRALYFNDEVTVGWVRGGDVVEIAVQDPRQGILFYTVDQEESPRPKIERRGECLQCHYSWSTLGVPGLLVRSVETDRNGSLLSPTGGYVTDHRSPFRQRWGGWYVSGTHGAQRHMGNAFAPARTPGVKLDVEAGANVTDLKGHFDTGAYLTPHSDIVALMVLEHQTRMTNLITRAGFEARIAIEEGKPAPEDAVEALVRYLLFAGEAKLEEPVRGTSSFTTDFRRRGPADRHGRSLREFDLRRRLFRYPCSYMIYSKAFDALPETVRNLISKRLWEVLSGQDNTPAFAHLNREDRRTILEILVDTKPGITAGWN
jgi:hypothetical protein